MSLEFKRDINMGTINIWILFKTAWDYHSVNKEVGDASWLMCMVVRNWESLLSSCCSSTTRRNQATFLSDSNFSDGYSQLKPVQHCLWASLTSPHLQSQPWQRGGFPQEPVLMQNHSPSLSVPARRESFRLEPEDWVMKIRPKRGSVNRHSKSGRF